jgi:hypothetical protein
MRAAIILLAAGAALAATAAAADPRVEVRHAAARVVVVPEARSDVVIQVLHTNPKLPLRVTHEGDSVVVDGGLGWRSPNCHGSDGHYWVDGWGMGRVGWDELPQILVHTPLKAHVAVSGAVFGNVGRGQGLEFSNAGCGDWTVADQAGPLHVSLAGSGDVRAGAAAATEAHISGSSDLYLRQASGGLTAGMSGSGDINAGRVDGPLKLRISGSGDVDVRGGQVGDMYVSIAGSGDVKFGGVATSLEANIAGSGDVTVAHVTGAVVKHVAGSGDVNVGR